jgi:hypothetical protein
MSDFFHVGAIKRHGVLQWNAQGMSHTSDCGTLRPLNGHKAAIFQGSARKNRQFNILAPCPKSLSLLEFAALFYPRVA